MASVSVTPYKAREFKLAGLKGISDQQLEIHFGLYNGYVTNTNKLTDQLANMLQEGKAAGTDPVYAELTRRLGFEYNGMILHEYYFGNLTSSGSALDENSALGRMVAQRYGSVENWLADFKAVGGMRGVGWAICFQDPVTNTITNQWVTLHQDGNPAGFKPLLVMDVWEHAFMIDYKPAERGKYIEAFFQNVDWNVVNARLASAAAERPTGS